MKNLLPVCFMNWLESEAIISRNCARAAMQANYVARSSFFYANKNFDTTGVITYRYVSCKSLNCFLAMLTSIRSRIELAREKFKSK